MPIVIEAVSLQEYKDWIFQKAPNLLI
jgi:hypothetical protein